MARKLTLAAIKKQAAEAIEMKLGFKPSWNDLEIQEFEIKETGEAEYLVEAVFTRTGFPKVVYTAAYRFHEWKLIIQNVDTEKELLIT